MTKGGSHGNVHRFDHRHVRRVLQQVRARHAPLQRRHGQGPSRLMRTLQQDVPATRAPDDDSNPSYTLTARHFPPSRAVFSTAASLVEKTLTSPDGPVHW